MRLATVTPRLFLLLIRAVHLHFFLALFATRCARDFLFDGERRLRRSVWEKQDAEKMDEISHTLLLHLHYSHVLSTLCGD